MTDKKPKQKEKLSFEKALERLETIVAEMEGGKLSLEKMTAGFEEGQDLLAFCTGKLNEVERKIEILVKKGGKTVTKPFEVEDAETEEPADDSPEENEKDKDKDPDDSRSGELF